MSSSAQTKRIRYFLLSVAINEYTTMKPLQGCVNDAEAIKNCLHQILGPAPPSAIRCLTNSEATRSAIISAFRTHLIGNSAIQRGDAIVVFFAGHGSQVPAPDDWEAPDGSVETLCPVDQGLPDRQREHRFIPGIPDVTLNALFHILASVKGNNITFISDSCHSGGISRSNEDGQFIGSRLGVVHSLRSGVDLTIDRDILREADGGTYKFGFRGNYSSHVILAACAAHETASEYQTRSTSGVITAHGKFTAALTAALLERQFDIPSITYEMLISSLRLSGQRPQCDGQPASCFIFTRRDKIGPSLFRLDPDPDDHFGFILAAGDAHGIGIGAEMALYRDNSTAVPPGILVVHDVGSTFARLRRKPGAHFDIHSKSWVQLHRWSESAAYKIHVDFPLDLPENTAEFAYPLVVAQENTDANVVLRLNSSDVKLLEIQNRDPTVIAHCNPISTLSLHQGESISTVMSKLAHFHFHLHRRHASSSRHLPVSSGKPEVTLRLYHLAHPQTKKNMFKNNIAHVEITPNTRSCYGIEIRNTGHLDLYAYVFAFDPDDYSVTAIYMPPLGSASPPLRSRSHIAVGYGASGGYKIDLALNDNENTALFLKLIVCSENLNLQHILQHPLNPNKARLPSDGIDGSDIADRKYHAACDVDAVLWDTALSTIKISKPGFHFRKVIDVVAGAAKHFR
ncbi:caspase domain-containing protein [Mycena crocata]|nr:caspase domain-containing protein [Mycena crocata]